jgi:methyltransferase
MHTSVVAYIALLVFVGLLRLFELGISRRNQQRMLQSGARKPVDPGFRWMVIFHAAFLISAGLEVLLLHRPLIPALAVCAALVFVLSNLLRYWVIRTLAVQWNVQVMDSTALGVVTTGPFRWIRHPNYLGVFLEMTSLALIHTAWITAVWGAIGYAVTIRDRIVLEEKVLMSSPTYRERMASKPRFLPGLF